MLYEIRGVCNHCAADYKVIISDSETHGICPECGEKPIKFRKIKGMVYVINNPNQRGVKVGLTTKDINNRLRSLSSTGVPGKFELLCIFPSNDPKTDEKKAHEKLRKFFLDKEHFDIEPLNAILLVYSALNRREPIFYSPKMEEEFNKTLDIRKETMQKKLSGIKTT
jgi:hypothetical protein